MNKKSSIENVMKYINLFNKYGSLLTERQQFVFKLYFLEDLSYSEIAAELATTRTAAYDAVSKAIKKLLKIEEELNK
ncbi:sigma factor-like helix-turn-helix DNA-binding protein [Mycoplasmopsis gallopavonis]|uniref:Sigma-70 factor-like HTH protein n=1 Tax=Mycoplasmopsis gallopavonis TaxID=76629 RepID=A0A449AZP2_9BACT|nr:sigma factor-like helix-turn-helix DNA-binding protein [Mycoplasmopsis gallopavonis]RIV16329.1 hypothetical protein D1113_02795 [Mycoplasmopsis gallopavonis]VEU72926.1 sigma-70 factor-like HTH protein [Mycoplasmopsis gallopavonis]